MVRGVKNLEESGTLESQVILLLLLLSYYRIFLYIFIFHCC